MKLSAVNSSRFYSILLILLCPLLLVSCFGAGAGPDSDRDKISSFLGPLKTESDAVLYDLTSLTNETENDLCSYGLYDQNSIILLYGTGKEAGGSVSGYSARLLDLRDGSIQELISFERAPVSSEVSDGTQEIEILSADPLVIHDRRCGVVYRPGADSEAVILPEWLAGSSVYCMEGRVWLCADRGILYEITQDGLSAPVWSLPHTYGSFTPVTAGHEGMLTFATSLRQNPSEQIYVDVNPVTGESSFYQSSLNAGRFSVSCNGLLLGTTYRSDPAVSVCDPSKGTMKELEFPELVQAILRGDAEARSEDGGNGFAAFGASPLSLCGDWCCWMISDDELRPLRLYLWDISTSRSDSWKIPSITPFEEPVAADYGDLSLKASSLEDQYGVRIILGENVPTEFADYTAQFVTDEDVIEGSLEVLGNVLSLYPEGYWDALKGGYYRDIVFYLTGPLIPLNADSNISNASAFATESGGVMQLAFDLYDDLSPATVIHELTHAADYRFIGEGIWNEEEWNSLNPDGFTYYNAYIDENGESYETSGSPEYTAMGGSPADEVYFIDPYSKTYAMEDRARLMENLLSGTSPYESCYSGPHVQEKLSYYFNFLRETLGGDAWTSPTTWEEALQNASSLN